MGNTHCPPEDASHLASVARDICPFPDYNTNPLFGEMLSINSSSHLRERYMEAQLNLTTRQQDVFARSLRTTFGSEGKVTHGGVGVVALSLAVLFDTLARQARGERVSDSGPIPGLFMKDLRGYQAPHVHTISQYLRLVPHIANNPSRMREETERHFEQLKIDFQSLNEMGENHTLAIKDDIMGLNLMLGQLFTANLMLHLRRINVTAEVTFPEEVFQWLYPGYMGIIPTGMIFNLNCDPDAADKVFLAKVQQSGNRTQEAFNRCKSGIGETNVPETWLLYVAQLEWLDVMFLPSRTTGSETSDEMLNQREDFDLKANARVKWAE